MISPSKRPVVGERCACVCTEKGYLRRPLGGARGAAEPSSRQPMRAARANRRVSCRHVRKRNPRTTERQQIQFSSWKTSAHQDARLLFRTSVIAKQHKQEKSSRNPNPQAPCLRKRVSAASRAPVG